MNSNVAINDSENLARFIFVSNHIRSDGTVKPDAFIPPKTLDLSVTRHLRLTEEQIWEAGIVAKGQRVVELYGRADVIAQIVRKESLDVISDEPPPNHAVIVGWASDKPLQKMKAQFLAAKAKFTQNPDRL